MHMFVWKMTDYVVEYMYEAMIAKQEKYSVFQHFSFYEQLGGWGGGTFTFYT